MASSFPSPPPSPPPSPLSRQEASYLFLTTTYCTLLVVSNATASKLFTVPLLRHCLPVGVVIYPATFLLTDVISELFGSSRSHLTVWLGLGMSAISWIAIQLALALPPHPAWLLLGEDWGYTHLDELQRAYALTFSTQGWALAGSITAYLLAQIVDIQLFHWVKNRTKGKHLWLRNLFSTACSQVLDTLTVNLIFLYLGLGISLHETLSIGFHAYSYKLFFALCATPLCYLLVALGQKFLCTSHFPIELESSQPFS